MAFSPSITEDQVTAAVGDFLQANVAVSSVVVGQVNRVPQPEGDMIVMWPLRKPRLATNAETYSDVKFEASIAGVNMTVTTVDKGPIVTNRNLFGDNVETGTIIQSQSSGSPGGPGVYVVSISQTVASEPMAAGSMGMMQETEYVMQIDVHGPNSSDNAQVVSTLLRSSFANDALDPTGVSPLYCEDPKQMPFMPASDQYEDRWTIDAHFQIDPVIVAPQQFSDRLSVELYNVDQPPA
jgi:hypothetical protein